MKQYTPQEIVDTVIPLMVEQGCPSVDEEGNCEYRGPNGVKCAAGFFLTDREAKDPAAVYYHPDFKEQGEETLAVLASVQTYAHDANSLKGEGFIPAFLSTMKAICEEHNLKFPEEYAQWK